jgi:hypothetical protein
MAEEILAGNSLNRDNKGNEPRDKKKESVTEKNFFFFFFPLLFPFDKKFLF